jgi:hypothetical protein
VKFAPAGLGEPLTVMRRLQADRAIDDGRHQGFGASSSFQRSYPVAVAERALMLGRAAVHSTSSLSPHRLWEIDGIGLVRAGRITAG